MFAYYLDLALRSFRRNRILTVLMVLAIALGIGACMTTMTVFRVLSGDPIPERSERLYYVQLDAEGAAGQVAGDEPAGQLTRFDAEALLREARGDRQAMMSGGSAVVRPAQAGLDPFIVNVRYTSADFFAMFGTPFLYGGGWRAADDQGRARLVVLSREANERLFGGEDSTGRSLRVDDTDFQVAGVLDRWRPTPYFFDLNASGGRFRNSEELFLPFQTAIDLKMRRRGTMSCWGDTQGDDTGLNAPCIWIQYWVELDTPDKVAAYRDYLERYSDQQRAAGRFERPTNTRLRDVMAWLRFNEVVPGDVRLQLWLSLGFLLVCLVNTVGLLLAKCLRRSPEIGVRRALGASRRAIFLQFLVEAGVVGLAGGALGLGLAWLGLWAVRQTPVGYADAVGMDWQMLLFTLVLALLSSLAAGLLPAWRACQVSPASQIKSQ